MVYSWLRYGGRIGEIAPSFDGTAGGRYLKSKSAPFAYPWARSYRLRTEAGYHHGGPDHESVSWAYARAAAEAAGLCNRSSLPEGFALSLTDFGGFLGIEEEEHEVQRH
jgi:hypothetical protein